MKTLILCALVALAGAGLRAAEPSAAELVERAKTGPCLLFNREQLRVIREKIAADERAKAWWADFAGAAKRLLAESADVPDRGGQWTHWYTCRKCGTRLKALSPTRHACKACGEIHAGQPYDDVYVALRHSALAAAVRELGIAYALSGEAAYAERVRKILLGYAARYAGFAWHDRNGPVVGPRKGGARLAAQILDESVLLVSFLEGYDAVRETIPVEDRARIERDFIRASAETVMTENAKWSNHECWHLSAYGLAGLVLGDVQWVEKSLNSKYGAKNQLRNGVLADGCWWEVSPGYHFYTMDSFVAYFRALANLGLALPELYRKMFVAPIRMLGPDGRMPAINDSGDCICRPGAYPRFYELAYSWWNDDLFGWWVNAAPRRDVNYALWGRAGRPTAAVEFDSCRYDASGLAILRSRTPGFAGETVGDMPDNCLVVDYGPHGGWHGHPDKLSVNFWSHGRFLAEDPGCLGYGNLLHWGWYKSTLAHNTVRIDGRNQRPAEGNLLGWTVRGNATAVAADAGPIAEGVRARRLCARADDVFLDCLWVESAAEHQYEWVFHGRGELSVSVATEPVVGLPSRPQKNPHYGRDWSGEDSWSWVDSPRKGAHAGEWSATWAGKDGVTMRLRQKSAAGELWTAVGGSMPPPAKAPFVANRVRAKAAAFPTVVTCGNGAVKIERAVSEPDGTVGLVATVGERRLVLLYNASGTCHLDGRTYTGKVVLVQ